MRPTFPEPAESDRAWMARALVLARQGAGWVNPNPLVGAVLVKDGEVVGEGYHPRIGGPHAEVVALQAAGDRARGATAYVTLEPCNHVGRTGPCTQALIRAGVSRVVYACPDPNPRTASQADSVLREAGVEVASGVLAREAEALNEAFFTYITTGRPFVTMKMAMSLDGKTALANGTSKWITGSAARERVQELRAMASAVMVGIGTVLADDPRLTARVEGAHQPARVIVDPYARTPVTAALFEGEAPVLLAVGPAAPAERRDALARRGAVLLDVPALADGHLDLGALMRLLGDRELSSVLMEGGGSLNASAVAQGIVHKLIYFIAPTLIGGAHSLTPLEGPDPESLSGARRLRQIHWAPCGDDLQVEAYL